DGCVPAAERVGDVTIDLGLVARQPVEVCATVGDALRPCSECQFGQDARWDVGAAAEALPCENEPGKLAGAAGGKIGVPDRCGPDAIGMSNDEVRSDQPAHGMAEQDDREPGMAGRDEVVHGRSVRDDLFGPVTAEAARRGVGRGGPAMAAMVMRVDMEAPAGQEFREMRVAGGVFGEAMIDLDDGAGVAVRFPDVELQPRAGGRVDALGSSKGHVGRGGQTEPSLLSAAGRDWPAPGTPTD